MSKSSTATEQLNSLKYHSTLQLKSGQLSDVTKILRKEEVLKKKIKNILEINNNFQKQIKIHQSQIKDERNNINFQLEDLNKEMLAKFEYFVEQKLEKTSFKTNQIAHRAIQSMMQKYEKIDKQCAMLRKIFQSIQQIHSQYEEHSKEVVDLVLNLEKSNQDYEEQMDVKLSNINEQIKAKILSNEQIDNHTQEMIRQIDFFAQQSVRLKEEQQCVRRNIQRLRRMACKQQERVNEIQEWAQIIIDKNSRKIVHKTLQQKQQYFEQLKLQNNQLEIYLFQLQNQHQFLKNQEECLQSAKLKSIRNISGSKTKNSKRKILKNK